LIFNKIKEPAFAGSFLSEFANHTAGDLIAGITGRLGVKIIRCIMNDHRSADHIVKAKPVCINHHICPSVAHQKRRQIAGMVRKRSPK